MRFRKDFLAAATNSAEVRAKLIERAMQEFHLVRLGDEKMSDAEIEALSQHHGLPTRLMDWTYSPYTALFFALDAGSVSKSGAVECAVFEVDVERFVFASCYSVDRDESTARSQMARTYAFSKDVNVMSPKILTVDGRGNERMRRQDGVFLLLPDKYPNLENFEAECMSLHPDCEFLTKRTIPNAERLRAIRHLQDMGSRASSIFCDSSYATVDAGFRTLASLV